MLCRKDSPLTSPHTKVGALIGRNSGKGQTSEGGDSDGKESNGTISELSTNPVWLIMEVSETSFLWFSYVPRQPGKQLTHW